MLFQEQLGICSFTCGMREMVKASLDSWGIGINLPYGLSDPPCHTGRLLRDSFLDQAETTEDKTYLSLRCKGEILRLN